MLLALGDGRALPASLLAAEAEVTPATVSSHLGKLVAAGLLTVEQHGRHRYFRLAGPEVGELIETLTRLAPTQPIRSLRQGIRANALRQARTCYDHLAGALGVALTDSLERQQVIEPVDGSYRLTRAGQGRLEDLGLDVPALRERRRAFARPCLDWTERRPHLAGALGAGLAERLLELEWLCRVPGSRALRITETGQRRLRDELGLNLA